MKHNSNSQSAINIKINDQQPKSAATEDQLKDFYFYYNRYNHSHCHNDNHHHHHHQRHQQQH